jgi:uncharacterized protein YbjT (DUF2867 family)
MVFQALHFVSGLLLAFPLSAVAAVREASGLPAHIVPLAVVPVDRPTGEDAAKDKWKPERLHRGCRAAK